MHLSLAALDAAIRLLETGDEFREEILEAAGKEGPFCRWPFDARSASLRLADRLLRAFSLEVACHERTLRFA